MGRWANEYDAGVGASVGEIGVLGQKSIAGMNRIGVCFTRGINDPIDVQIGWADGGGFMACAGVRGVPIGVRKHNDRRDSHGAARVRDTKGYFTAVRDQKFSDRQAVIICPLADARGYLSSSFKTTGKTRSGRARIRKSSVRFTQRITPAESIKNSAGRAMSRPSSPPLACSTP